MFAETTIAVATPPAQFVAAVDLPLTGLGQWFVLHVKSRQEKALAEDLGDMGIGYYLPLVRRLRYYGRHKVNVDTALFPGYLFLRGTLQQTYSAEKTHRIARVIPVTEQEQLDWELRNLQLALSQQAPLDPYPYLRKGVRAEVRSGPLRGLQGIVEDRGRFDRLILQVAMLGRAVSLEIDASLLEPVE